MLIPLIIFIFYNVKIVFKKWEIKSCCCCCCFCLYSNRQSSNFLTIEIQSNLNLLRNGSYEAKSIEYSNYKQGHTFSFIKQVLNKIIEFLPCPVLVLSFVRILNHVEHFIEERCGFYSLSMDTPCFQDGCCKYTQSQLARFHCEKQKPSAAEE